MRTESVNNINFQRKFREPVRYAARMMGNFPEDSLVLRNYIKEYENPNAKTIYNEAKEQQRLGNWSAAANLFRQMGSYEIKKPNIKERITFFLEDIMGS